MVATHSHHSHTVMGQTYLVSSYARKICGPQDRDEGQSRYCPCRSTSSASPRDLRENSGTSRDPNNRVVHRDTPLGSPVHGPDRGDQGQAHGKVDLPAQDQPGRAGRTAITAVQAVCAPARLPLGDLPEVVGLPEWGSDECRAAPEQQAWNSEDGSPEEELPRSPLERQRRRSVHCENGHGNKRKGYRPMVQGAAGGAELEGKAEQCLGEEKNQQNQEQERATSSSVGHKVEMTGGQQARESGRIGRPCPLPR